MGLLVGLGIAVIALIAFAGGKKGANAYQILIQTPAPIPASEQMIATAMGISPDNYISMNSPAMGQLIVRAKMSNPPAVGTTINFFGVPGTVQQVEAIPVA